MAHNRMQAELAAIEQSLTERLSAICEHMSEHDFSVMVQSMALVQWRSEHRSADLLLADGMHYGGARRT